MACGPAQNLAQVLTSRRQLHGIHGGPCGATAVATSNPPAGAFLEYSTEHAEDAAVNALEPHVPHGGTWFTRVPVLCGSRDTSAVEGQSDRG
jgi:hypothetical protein